MDDTHVDIGVTPTEPLAEARIDTTYRDRPAPAYPLLSRRLGEEGLVILRVSVDAYGDVTAVATESSSGHERLDQAARHAVSRWRFLAAHRGQETFASTVLVPVRFDLSEAP